MNSQLAALTQPSPACGRGFSVSVPSWRNDIEGAADLVEEILRIHGYDNIPYASLPVPLVATSTRTPKQKAVVNMRRELAVRGLTEVVTWSFMDSTKAALFTPVKEELRLLNPISSDLDAMRPSILPNLLDAAKRNANRSFTDLAFFEIGPAYRDAKPGQGQDVMVAGIRTGQNATKNIYKDERKVDVFDAKADALAALKSLGAPDSTQIVAEAPHWYHPGRSGAVKLGKTVLGYFGELHPTLLQKLDVEGIVVGFEIFVDALPPSKPKKTTAKPKLELSAFQAVTRDFAFVVAKEETVENILRVVRKVDKLLIDDARVFDIYAGKGVEEGKKSIAIAIRLQPKEKTLTDAEIEAVAANVVSAVEKEVGGVLRG